jgi:acyl carrier protein
MVDNERFLEIVKLQFEEAARKSISMNSAFKQIPGWSSLQALIVTVAIHDEWGVSFTDEDFRNSQTLQELYQITQLKVNK